MASGKYARIDNRRPSSSYGSMVVIAVFVALCLIGLWMMTSSSVVLVQNVDVSQDNKNDVKDQVRESHEGTTQQFEDNPGDLLKDGRKDNDLMKSDRSNNSDKVESGPNKQVNQEKKPKEKSAEKPLEKIEEKTLEGGETKLEDGSKIKTGYGEGIAEDRDSKVEHKEKITETREPKTDAGESDSSRQGDSEGGKSDPSEREQKSDESKNKSENSSERKDGEKASDQINETVEQNDKRESNKISGENKENSQSNNQTSSEAFPSGARPEILNENSTQSGAWSTQVVESKNEKESQKLPKQQTKYNWKLCNVTAGPDYIPCLDNWQALRRLRSTKHYEHRERHCPEEPPTCLVSLPDGYRHSIAWPKSREKIWFYNVPHTKLVQVKGKQNWIKVSGEYLTFPGGGTQFKKGAVHYIDFLKEAVPDIEWGKHAHVTLDVGCGVASFGGFLFERDVLTMSLAPKDEHEAQVQFALERGIPAISAVMGTKRLPYPGRVFDLVHCARCRVPWHVEGGKLLLELNRVLRPGGFFVWSATPVYKKLPDDVKLWNAMKELMKAMCWELVSISKDHINNVAAAICRKPTNNDCYENRLQKEPPICSDSDDPNAAWNEPLQACMHKIPVNASERGSQWPEQWPARLEKPPYWLLSSQVGVYGKAAPEDFTADYEHWKRVKDSYLHGVGIDWSSVRNIMDMRSVYGGFAAVLKDVKVWVMNVVPIDSPDTLPIIYERGLFGLYHDWCESFSTYPRSYDLLHADHLFSKIKKRCNLVAVVAEVDRILRPEGHLIVRDNAETLSELENMVKSMRWDVQFTYNKDNEGLLCAQKSMWRPTEWKTLEYAIA